MITSEIEPIEKLRQGFNRIPEWDAQGNEQRFLWQILGGIGAILLVSSANPTVARAGRLIGSAVVCSFLDLLNAKANRWIAGNL